MLSHDLAKRIYLAVGRVVHPATPSAAYVCPWLRRLDAALYSLRGRRIYWSPETNGDGMWIGHLCEWAPKGTHGVELGSHFPDWMVLAEHHASGCILQMLARVLFKLAPPPPEEPKPAAVRFASVWPQRPGQA